MIIKYNIYVGLNDKDSKKQEISTRKARDEVIKILNDNIKYIYNTNNYKRMS